MTVEELALVLPSIDLINDLDYRSMTWDELRFMSKLERRYGLGILPAVEVLGLMKFWEWEQLRDIIEKHHKSVE